MIPGLFAIRAFARDLNEEYLSQRRRGAKGIAKRNSMAKKNQQAVCQFPFLFFFASSLRLRAFA
ncbi:hypothetical protein PLANPX_2210 [Lacipirellula parvula]|uniref:Uncharacterized protein n=1 Tax=Lacipirellula parvula TaxID=2650471 RepID=A0A5K7X7Q5_9BACT|nr:hypothetical protein PLANPX_2210 [Lacipirellula parvula]